MRLAERWWRAWSPRCRLSRRKHDDDRRFPCPVEGCGKSFTRAEHLKGHSVTHLGTKPFACPVEGGCERPHGLLAPRVDASEVPRGPGWGGSAGLRRGRVSWEQSASKAGPESDSWTRARGCGSAESPLV